jgi:hypothetical protein
MAELQDLGAQATPATVIETASGREVVLGFDQDRLRKLLPQGGQ